VNLSINWLPEVAYFYLVIFARVGVMLMLLPALGETSIPSRLRLAFALLFTFVLFPLLSPTLPKMPNDFMPIFALIFHELAVGFILGGIIRIFVMSTQVAGQVIAFQSGLSFAQSADPTQGVQGAIFGSFMSLVGVTLIFATNLHHMALAGVYDSYSVFTPTAPLMFDDAAQLAIKAVSGAFTVGIQMSAPFIVFGLIFNLGMGILSRLMPQLQVYFIAMPANIGVGLILFALLLATMMGWYLSHFEMQLAMLRR
jgi:flagellar biosynthetic protein FliR